MPPRTEHGVLTAEDNVFGDSWYGIEARAARADLPSSTAHSLREKRSVLLAEARFVAVVDVDWYLIGG